MSVIEKTSRRFWIMLAVLSIACVCELGVLLSPIGASASSRQAQLDELRADLRSKVAANEPLRDIDKQMADAQEQVAGFYRDRLPSSYAAISEKLDAVASKAGVSLSTGHYKADPSGVPGLQRLLIDATITGDYLHAVQFINATEREQMFLVVDSVSLTQQQGRTVQLQIRIEAFLMGLSRLLRWHP